MERKKPKKGNPKQTAKHIQFNSVDMIQKV